MNDNRGGPLAGEQEHLLGPGINKERKQNLHSLLSWVDEKPLLASDWDVAFQMAYSQ